MKNISLLTHLLTVIFLIPERWDFLPQIICTQHIVTSLDAICALDRMLPVLI